jgi:hypothetical protein
MQGVNMRTKHSREFLTNYGIRNYGRRIAAASDGYPNDGKWYHRMQDGFACGDDHTVLRIRMAGKMPIAQEYREIEVRYDKD